MRSPCIAAAASSTWSTSARPSNRASPLSQPPSRLAAPPARTAIVSAGTTMRALSALAAFGVADHARATALLAFGPLVALARAGIVAGAECDAHRRALEAVALAAELLAIA